MVTNVLTSDVLADSLKLLFQTTALHNPAEYISIISVYSVYNIKKMEILAYRV